MDLTAQRQRFILLILAGVACLSLGMGYLVYFIARTTPAIPAIPGFLEPFIAASPLLFPMSGQLPSFFHCYGFILLTFVMLGAASHRQLYASITLWLMLETLFEIGQHPLPGSALVGVLADPSAGCAELTLCRMSVHYFLQGVFDPLDLLAITLAALAAFYTVQIINPEKEDGYEQD